MPRKKKNKILEEKTKNDYTVEQVIEEDNVFSVIYDGNFFSIKKFNKIVEYPGPKYKKILFYSKKQAINFAKKMNEKFKTNRFKPVKINFEFLE
ncbi:MAG: hypothetical protein QXF12_01630 [Candidatus Aenigmatarchaeota archaeon]